MYTPVAATTVAPRLLLSVDEATAALGISRSKVYQYLRTGRLPSVTLGRRRLIRSDDLCAFVAELGA